MKKIPVLIVTAVVTALTVFAENPKLTLSLNPYRNVQWDKARHCKANLHTHTTASDGSYNPHQVVDRYHQAGYQVLALTDHDNRCISGRPTWPWQEFDRIQPSAKSQTNLLAGKLADYAVNLNYENRDPAALDMVAVPANEMSRHLHSLSLFSDWYSASTNLDEQLNRVAGKGGLAVMCHPAWHWTKNKAAPISAGLPEAVVQNYISLYTKHLSLAAIEVINGTVSLEHRPYDRELWDRILDALMPARPVWGLAVDDLHNLKHFGIGWVVFPVPVSDAASMRQAFADGAFYFSGVNTVPAPAGASDSVPKIENITHDAAKGRIALTASINGKPVSENACIWIGEGGKTIHTGLSIDYRSVPGIRNYVRAEISGPAGTTFTNPFGFTAH